MVELTWTYSDTYTIFEKYLIKSTSLFNPSNAETTIVQSTRRQRSLKPSKPCHVGIHWIALLEYSQVNIHVPGFQGFCIIQQ